MITLKEWMEVSNYRITEGSEEIQMRKVASNLFGFASLPDRR